MNSQRIAVRVLEPPAGPLREITGNFDAAAAAAGAAATGRSAALAAVGRHQPSLTPRCWGSVRGRRPPWPHPCRGPCGVFRVLLTHSPVRWIYYLKMDPVQLRRRSGTVSAHPCRGGARHTCTCTGVSALARWQRVVVSAWALAAFALAAARLLVFLTVACNLEPATVFQQ